MAIQDEVLRNGGTVFVDKDKKTGYVNAMLVQTSWLISTLRLDKRTSANKGNDGHVV